MIALESVGMAFGETWAVRGLDINIAPGEVFGLLGPNGAGKTTAMKMLSGLLRPTEGRVLIGGHDLSIEPEEAKSITGYIPDRGFLYEKLTAREFMVFSASLYGLPRKRAIERIDELSELFGLKEVQDNYLESCSQGMRQRVVFASALIHEPRALLVDEPVVGLDPFGVRLITKLIKALAADGAAVLLATHSLSAAQELCDRVGLLQRGRLLSVKSRDEVAELDGGLEAMFVRELGDGGTL